jgi:hypothetical protein
VSRIARLVVVAAAGLTAGMVLALVFPGEGVADLVILGTALVGSELFELRPVGRAPLPLSFAAVVVLVRASSATEFVAILVAGYLVSTVIRPEPAGLGSRVVLLAERLAEGLAAGVAYRVVVESSSRGETRAVVLGALGAAAVTPILVADVVTAVRERRVAPLRARGADLALVTSGMLMAVGYGGIEGDGRLGLWGPLLFSIPLLAAWYSFELLASTRRSYQQTVRALGVAPELGGLAREGHVERVADLAVAMGQMLDFSTVDLEHLETAALLHHLGSVCLDEPAAGSALDPFAVARAGAAMLRASEALAPAGDIVAAEPLLHRPPGAEGDTPAALAGQVLKVASAFDELTEGRGEHSEWAIEALYTGPGYVYDGRVLGALERVLADRA